MKKTYYVQSGALRETVCADSVDEAFDGAFMRALEKEIPLLGTLTSCSLHGFAEGAEDLRNDDVFIDTEVLLKRTGLITKFSKDYFKPEDIEPC